MSKYKNGKRVTFYSVLGKIGDFIMWPIMLISLLSSFFMIVQRQQNKVTSVFGFSFVNILSGSMVDEGFAIRDTVITKQVSERDVQLGDIVAFYYQTSTKPVGITHLVMKYNYTSGNKEVDYSDSNIVYGDYGETVEEISVNLKQIEKTDTKGQELLATAQEKNAKIYFHRVIGIYIDDAGNMFYQTKGSNNLRADSPLSRGDLLVGVYVNTPTVVRKAVSFCASTTGMIILVCFPLSLLVLMQCLSLIDQVSIISLEKKLISGKIPFEDESIQKDMTGSQMEVYNKVYYYYITPPEKRKAVKEYLWKDLYSSIELPAKKVQELMLVNKTLKLVDEDPDAYWNEWINASKGSVRKKFVEYRDQLLNPPSEDGASNDTTFESAQEVSNADLSKDKIQASKADDDSLNSPNDEKVISVKDASKEKIVAENSKTNAVKQKPKQLKHSVKKVAPKKHS